MEVQLYYEDGIVTTLLFSVAILLFAIAWREIGDEMELWFFISRLTPTAGIGLCQS